MRAGLERDVHRRAARVFALAERMDLRVRLAGALMPPFREDILTPDDHASDHRIRTDRIPATLRER
jgi:hypothetical protein